MNNRTFRLILDGKKGGLVKGSSPSSAAKKACKKLSAEQMKNSTVFHQLSLKDKVLKTEPGKTSFKFELQETTKDSKKKVYGPYKAYLGEDKIKVKIAGGRPKGQQMANLNPYGDQSIYEAPYNTTPEKLYKTQGYKILNKIPNQHKIKMEFDELYNQPLNYNYESFKQKEKKLKSLLMKYEKSNATNENKNELQKKYYKYGKLNQLNKELFNRFLGNANRANKYGINSIEEKNAEIKRIEDIDRAKSIIRHFLAINLEEKNPKLFEKIVTAIINKNFKIKNYQEMRELILEIEPSVPLSYIKSRIEHLSSFAQWSGNLYHVEDN